MVLVAAIVICWIARVRIQAAEDTLSGTALARWGLVVGLFFGVIYSAYLASSDLAVSNQARLAAEHFLQRIEESDLAGAFLLTLKPSARPPRRATRARSSRCSTTPPRA